jgi:uncharacterized membrane protein YphA (DoxX/SURF4 family)
MKAKALGYWICTAPIAFIFVSGGAFYVMRVPQGVEGVTHLGFPLYIVTLLGVWKMLGGIAVLMPDFARRVVPSESSFPSGRQASELACFD